MKPLPRAAPVEEELVRELSSDEGSVGRLNEGNHEVELGPESVTW